MIIAQVIGSVVSTIKHPCYKNKKILLVKPMSPDGDLQPGVMVAVDLVGAGKGDQVLVASEGRAAEELLQFSCRMPVRSLIVGIIDHQEKQES
jgi:microcompartment protein CcmK/EutM